MRILLVAEASSRIEHLLKIWGLSFLIDDDVLFDAFSDEAVLGRNFRRFGIDPGTIRHIVVSHDHWDHTGGLAWILSNVQDATVYVCRGSSEGLKKRISSFPVTLVEIHDSVRIRDNILSTGEIETRYKGNPLFEQSLLVEENNVPGLVTGCSHPGIVEIVERAQSIARRGIALVAGGFHLHDKSDEEIARAVDILSSSQTIECIAPMHCTGRRPVRLIRRRMRDAFVRMKPGDAISFDHACGKWVRQKSAWKSPSAR
jgi:7,8-dihydropterin-6-yl-methyl-4-(beta-D-ribofuranosyl)aminobenzene 5'-phosphate synthase